MGHTTGTLGAEEIRFYRGLKGMLLIGVSVAAQSQPSRLVAIIIPTSRFLRPSGLDW